ncbi:hypothetical protein [Trueperella pyogenes]
MKGSGEMSVSTAGKIRCRVGKIDDVLCHIEQSLPTRVEGGELSEVYFLVSDAHQLLLEAADVLERLDKGGC